MHLLRILVAAVFVISFAQPSEAQTPEVRTAGSGNVQFSVRFPQKSEQVGGAGKDPAQVQHQFAVGGSTGVLMLAYQDYKKLDFNDPKAAQLALKRAIDGFCRGVGGKLQSQKKLTMKRKGITAVEIQVKIPARSGVSTSRMYLIGKRWYHVFAMGTSDFVKSKRSQNFLKSVIVADAKSTGSKDRPNKKPAK